MSNYQIHEKMYQDLRSSGASGWGGKSFEERMSSWSKTIQELGANPLFPKAPAKVLELGSGAGDVSLQFAEIGYRVTGLEISDTAVSWANEKAISKKISANFIQGNVCDLSRFEDNSFDAIVDGNCFHCIIGKDRMTLLNEVRRVLIPDGIFYVSTMIGDPKDKTITFDQATRCQLQNGIPYRYMGTQIQLLDEITTAGFQIEQFATTQNSWWDHLNCLARKIC